MGCWNGTCGISGLPITAGDKVKVVFLQDQVTKRSQTGSNNPIGSCYPDDLWKPISLAFDAYYNDYGSAEDFTVTEYSKYFLKQINAWLQDESLTCHAGYDGSTTKSYAHLDDFCNDVERGRVGLSTEYSEGYALVTFMMIHADVWDAMTENKKVKQSVKRLDRYIELFKEALEKEQSFYGKIKKLGADMAMPDDLVIHSAQSKARAELWKEDNRNGFAHFFTNFQHSEKFRDSLDGLFFGAKQNASLMKEMRLVVAEWLQIEYAMNVLRRAWAPPQSGTGSQSTGWEEHKRLNRAIVKVINSKIKEEEEWG